MFGGLFSVSKSRVHRAAEHSVHPGKVRRGGASPIPCKERRRHGGGTLRVFRQFFGLKLVPSKWRSLVPAAANANRCGVHHRQAKQMLPSLVFKS